MGKTGLLGIDIGGTSVKAVVCDDRGRILSQASAPTLPAYDGDGQKTDTGPQRRFRAEALWGITKSVIMEAVRRLPSGCRIYSAAVSSVGCTVLAFDEEDNQIPVYAAASVLEQEYNRLTKWYKRSEFEAMTGYPMENTLTGLHLAGCGQNGRKIAKVFSVDDFIVYKLTGICSRNYSTAVSCGMWDTENDGWADFLKQRTGLQEAVLGKPLDSGVLVGTVSKQAAGETGLSAEVKVSTGGMDYQCAAFSVNHLIGDNLFNITGTIDLLAYYGKWENRYPRQFRFIRDYHVVPGVRNVMVEAVGAAQTEWLKNDVVAQRKYGFSLDWEGYFQGLAVQYQNQPVHQEIFIPQVFGSYIPFVDANATGVFGGLNRNTDSLMLLRTMLEGMAYQTRRMAGFLCGEDVSQKLVLVGGGSRNKAWVQLKADIMGRDIILPAVKETSAVGAALLGAVGAGYYGNFSEAGRAAEEFPCDYVFHDQSRSEYFNDIFKDVYLPLVEQWEQINRKISVINERYGINNEKS